MDSVNGLEREKEIFRTAGLAYLAYALTTLTHARKQWHVRDKCPQVPLARSIVIHMNALTCTLNFNYFNSVLRHFVHGIPMLIELFWPTNPPIKSKSDAKLAHDYQFSRCRSER